MTCTKTTLMNNMSLKYGFTNKKSSKIIESLLKILKGSLKSGEDVLISGFGKFYLNEKRKRRGRNPVTGDDLILDARRVITFKCSNKLRDRVNG